VNEVKAEKRIYLRLYKDRGSKRYKVSRTVGITFVEPGEWLTPSERKIIMTDHPDVKVITDESK